MALQLGISKREAGRRLNQVLGFLIGELEELSDGEKLIVKGFGTFTIRERKDRFIKHPRTFAKIYVKGHKYPHFRFANSVSHRIRAKEDKWPS